MPTRPPTSARRRVGDPRLGAIRAKTEAGERLTLEEGGALYDTPDVWAVCEMADAVRRRLHGGAAYYNINRHLNYSNVCALSCSFCEFYRKAGDEGAYTRDLAYVREEARRARDAGATEMHIVGGLHPTLPFSHYTDLLRAIREEAPALHLKAFTAVEIVHLARIAKVYKTDSNDPGVRREGIRWVLERLIEAGLGSLPGGGAEVFDDRVHDEAYKGKIRSDVWLDVHRVAHELGLNTNATILYGHIEDRAERLVHMDMLRRAQDEALARIGTEARRHEGTEGMRGAEGERGIAEDSAPVVTLTGPGARMPAAPAPGERPRGGYFQTIIPLPFFPDGSDLERLPGPGGLENLRTLAIARLMLDNFPHVKAFWIMQTLPMAELMLQCGADDLDGTVVWYDITKLNSGAGGAGTHQETSVTDLQRAIRRAGFDPVERDTLYRRVARDGAAWTLANRDETPAPTGSR